ncbi:hypothetical protein C8Q79DRAFT_438531 [Trametes meyenii]|nr:hypothetical protein C8Q79DRAFT_438531 [Trametes meyenii]
MLKSPDCSKTFLRAPISVVRTIISANQPHLSSTRRYDSRSSPSILDGFFRTSCQKFRPCLCVPDIRVWTRTLSGSPDKWPPKGAEANFFSGHLTPKMAKN